MRQLAELRSLIARHARPDEPLVALPGARLHIADAPTEPGGGLYEPTFAVIAQGAKRLVLGDKLFEYRDGQYLVVSIDLPITGQILHATPEEPYLSFAMTLKPATIAALLLETAVDGGVEAGPSGLAVSDVSGDLLDPIVRLVRLLDSPADIPVLGPMLEREIYWRLLVGEQGAMVRQIGLADSSLSQVGRAIRWIRGHFEETIRIEELASAAGMSASSFYRHFRAVTSMSPIQFQKHIRLQEARARLVANAPDVAAVGFEVGYDSPSQFSREYSRMFGAPPGRDMARLRTVPPLDSNLA